MNGYALNSPYGSTELFANLSKLLTTFENLLAFSHFLLIPGPTDPWSSAALPRPPIPEPLAKSLIAKIPNLTLGSNPCRVRWFSQEIVVFRDDLMGRMMRNAVRFPTEDGEGGGRKGDLRKAVSPTRERAGRATEPDLIPLRAARPNDPRPGAPRTASSDSPTSPLGLRPRSPPLSNAYNRSSFPSLALSFEG